MDSLTTLLKDIDSLREQLKKLKPVKAADEERLWKKFRLEWNYNSNHIEGNTLTYGQTELLLMFDKTTGDHEMREYEEMKAHDAVIHLVREFAKDATRELSESDIRQWNKTILVRPFWSDAQTPSGQPTKKKITPGEYKKEQNSVRLQNGELFHYASPEETPFMMNDLVNWYRDEVKKGGIHPVELAALLHYKFVRIHPFDDSNGRTSRLLMNYELLRNDLPPVIIKSADKKNYLFALNKADVGDGDAFVEYIGEQLKWSLQLNVKAAKGESVEEIDDIDKEIDIWTKSFNKSDLVVHAKSIDAIQNLYQNSLKILIDDLFLKHRKFNPTFLSNYVSFNEPHLSLHFENLDSIDGAVKEVLKSYRNPRKYTDYMDSTTQQWSVEFVHSELKGRDSINSFIRSELFIVFDYRFYEILDGEKSIYKNHYGVWLSKDDLLLKSNEIMKDVLAKVKSL